VKIIFIGTCSGKASLNRFYTSLFFSSENYNLLVDSGDGISRALLSNRINFNSIKGVLLTHLHPDHFSGLASLIVQIKMMNRRDSLEIFIHESLKTVIEEYLLKSYLLPDRMKFEIHYKVFRDNTQLKVSENISILPRKNSHLNDLEKYVESYPALSLYSASFLFQIEGKKIIYTSDIGSDKDLLLFNEFNPDIFISEVSHIPISVILDKIKIIKPGKIYLVHYSDEDEPMLREILATLSVDLRNKIILAEDGLSLKI
jgi:ribonuclease Z